MGRSNLSPRYPPRANAGIWIAIFPRGGDFGSHFAPGAGISESFSPENAPKTRFLKLNVKKFSPGAGISVSISALGAGISAQILAPPRGNPGLPGGGGGGGG